MSTVPARVETRIAMNLSPAESAVGRWRRAFSLDLRSLALFRIGLGACLLADLVTRLPLLNDFYTDGGILPRDVLLREFANPWEISIHLMSGLWLVQLALFLVAIVFALGVVAGYRTRLCTVASWLLLASMQARNHMIGHSGDTLLLLLLFWSMFVPLNGRFSLDQALHPSRPKLPVTHLSWGSLALMLQVCVVYWFTAAWKHGPVWTTEGSAIYYALSLDSFVTPFGKLLLRFPGLMRVMTFGTVLLEFFGPFLAFFPFRNGWFRLFVVLSFVALHAGIGTALYLGTFSWVCAAAWCMFLPAMVWDLLERRLAARSRGIVLLYDGNRRTCHQVVSVLRELLLLTGAEIREAPDVRAWAVRDPKGGLHTGYPALAVLCRHSILTAWLCRVLDWTPVRRVGEWLYHRAAAASPAGHVRALNPPAPKARLGLVANAAVIVCAFLAFDTNFEEFPGVRLELPVFWRRVATVLHLHQTWAMFAPHPNRDDGWYVIEGVELDGTRVDLWGGGGRPDYAKPSNVAATYRDTRWRKYLLNIWLADHRAHRLYFGRYLCRTWNDAHSGPQRVNLIYINYMLEETPAPGHPQPPAEKVLVWRHYCFEKPPDW
jgi:hypothetical protein